MHSLAVAVLRYTEVLLTPSSGESSELILIMSPNQKLLVYENEDVERVSTFEKKGGKTPR